MLQLLSGCRATPHLTRIVLAPRIESSATDDEARDGLVLAECPGLRLPGRCRCECDDYTGRAGFSPCFPAVVHNRMIIRLSRMSLCNRS